MRGVDDDTYRILVERARRIGRNLQQELRLVLEREARTERGSILESARRWRQRFEGRDLGDVVDDVRADRER